MTTQGKDKNQLFFDFVSDREHSYAEITGTVKNFIYENTSTGWKVAEVLDDKKNETVKLCGYLPNVREGDRINARCTESEHPQFGRSYQIDEFYKELPFRQEGVIKFMVACLDGVGEQTAEKIVSRFGGATLQIIEEKPEKLLEINGITEKKLAKIRQSSSNINTTVKQLMLLGFSHKWASRIYLKYSDRAVDNIKMHPYRLIRDFKGIGFKKAEIIAAQTGVGKLDDERIRAGIFFSMRKTLERTGHNFLYLDELTSIAARLLEIPRAYTESEILSQNGLVIEDRRVWLPEYYEAEKAVARTISDKLSVPPVKIDDFDAEITRIEQKIKIVFSNSQKKAIRGAYENPLTVITGAAGTGKTTLCRGLIELLKSKKRSFKVCAPTGKAAYKLESVTGEKASTIHRLFNYAPSEGFRVNADRPLEIGYLIVDEASMVDILLFKALLEGVSKNTRVIFIGDPYQLPPVEAGNSLQALVGSYSVSQVFLPEIFRQEEKSVILRNANMVNLEKPFPAETSGDFEFLDISEPKLMIRALFNSIEKLKKQGFHPIRDINVLTPLNKGGGDISVSNLNLRLRDFLNPAAEGNSFFVHDREFRMGDKVMQRKNDYELNIYNGDIGFITKIDPHAAEVAVDFFGEERIIPYSKMDNITLNYSMTVHKAQGSESRAVIFLATRAGCYFLLTKNLFYTAITRAKEKLVMIMPYEVVKSAVRYNIRRRSYLSNRIRKLVIGREKNGKNGDGSGFSGF